MYRELPKYPPYTRKEVVAFMRMKLRTNPTWTLTAVHRLYEMQTSEERRNSVCLQDNHEGFDRHHAPYLSSIARKYSIKHANTIPAEELEKLRSIVCRYAEQMIMVSDKTKLYVQLNKYYGERVPADKKIKVPKPSKVVQRTFGF